MLHFRRVAGLALVLASMIGGSGAAFAFGALAIDGLRGPSYGFSYNYSNVEDARARALKECGGNCTVVLTYQNTCAAFAADQSRADGATGWAWAPTKEEAQKSALGYCSKYGGKSCLVRVWACESLIAKDASAKATREGSPPAEGTVAAIPPPAPAPAPAAPAVVATAPPSVAPAPAAIAPLARLSADGARRVALVIGNDAYENLDHLQKAVNDARAISAALTQLGFDVISVENAPRRLMTQKIVEFAAKIGRGDTGFFFYSGHGVEIRGVNYLLAVDTPGANEGQEALITSEGIPADTIIEQLQERGAKVTMLVLDACRENPFKKAGSRGIGATRGLAQITAPEGVFVLYSAGVGQTALDRISDNDPNPNSVFTRTFSHVLIAPGMTVQEMAKTTQAEVRKLAATVNHPQMPAYYDQILGQFTFTQAR
jgi:hypothetical protein